MNNPSVQFLVFASSYASYASCVRIFLCSLCFDVSLMFFMKVMFLWWVSSFLVFELSAWIAFVLASCFSCHVDDDREEFSCHVYEAEAENLHGGRKPRGNWRGRRDSWVWPTTRFDRLRSGRGNRGSRGSPNNLSYDLKILCSEDLMFLRSFVFE